MSRAASLATRLRERRAEIEEAMLARAFSVSDPTEAGDPQYVEGLRNAVSAGLAYAISGIEAGDPQPGPIPDELFAQARSAARNGVSLDTVLRRYFAGYTLLGDFVIQEAEQSDLFGFEELQALGKTQAMLFERVVEVVSAEHRREAEKWVTSLGRRRAERVRALLAGELADPSELAYDFELWHLGAIAAGTGAGEQIRAIGEALGSRTLVLSPGDDTVWAWFGTRHRSDPEAIALPPGGGEPGCVRLAVGEPGRGLAGWRLTHRQAAAALPLAGGGPGLRVRYADVALLASVDQDEVLLASLRELYLRPLAKERDGGATLRQTLRAYFAAERNVSSTAAALGVTRNTVTARLQAVERRIGRPLTASAAGLEAALDLEQLKTAAVSSVVPAGR